MLQVLHSQLCFASFTRCLSREQGKGERTTEEMRKIEAKSDFIPFTELLEWKFNLYLLVANMGVPPGTYLWPTLISYCISTTRPDQNTDGALLEFPVRTLCTGNLAFRPQHLFAIINKISNRFLMCGGGSVGLALQ